MLLKWIRNRVPLKSPALWLMQSKGCPKPRITSFKFERKSGKMLDGNNVLKRWHEYLALRVPICNEVDEQTQKDTCVFMANNLRRQQEVV